jgi:hypothetical protein
VTETKVKEQGLTGVNTEAAEATRSAPDGKKLWTVKWQSAQLEAGDRIYGTMNTVSGTIFKNDKPVSDFYGEKGVSKKDSDVLALEGKVRVVSREQKATLYCDRLEWHGDRELAIAKGNVRVESPLFVMDAGSELWSNPELSQVATPDLYKVKHGRTP